MQKILVTMMALALTITAQGQTETIDSTQFVAVYDYECRTQNDEGQDITDRMQLAVQVGRTVVKSMPRPTKKWIWTREKTSWQYIRRRTCICRRCGRTTPRGKRLCATGFSRMSSRAVKGYG